MRRRDAGGLVSTPRRRPSVRMVTRPSRSVRKIAARCSARRSSTSRIGEAVAVFESHRDDREGGRNGVQELRRAGGPAAVVGRFEDVGAQRFGLFDHAPLDGPFRVAGEQEGMASVADAQDQGIVVLGGVGWMRNRRAARGPRFAAPPKANFRGAWRGTMATSIALGGLRAGRATRGLRPWRRSTAPWGGNRRPARAGRRCGPRERG